MSPVFFTIITVNYNNVVGLRKTLESVACQKSEIFEHVVIDGGSTDGSRELLQNFKKSPLTFISERDRGIYHAMNKGISFARGKFLLFLNSGDYLISNQVLDSCLIVSQFTKDIIYGNLFIETDGGLKSAQFPSQLNFEFFCNEGSLPHPATFIKKELFHRVGLYNEDLQIASDWEFWLKAIFLSQATYEKISIDISVFTLGGVSSRICSVKAILKEKKIILKKNFSAFYQDHIYFRKRYRKLPSSNLIRLFLRQEYIRLAIGIF